MRPPVQQSSGLMSYTMEGMFSSFLRQLKPTLEQIYPKFPTQQAYLCTSIWWTFNSRSFLIKNTFMNTALFSELEGWGVYFINTDKYWAYRLGKLIQAADLLPNAVQTSFWQGLPFSGIESPTSPFILKYISIKKRYWFIKKIPLAFCTFGRVCWLLLKGEKLFLSLILFALQFVNVSC